MLKSIAKQILPKPIWAFLRSKRLEHLVTSYTPKVRTGKYGGHELKVSIQDPLAEGWYGQDWSFNHELEILKKFKLKPGAKIFDLGAHQSVIAMVFAKEVGPTGKVLSIEANSHNFKVGSDNKALNQLNQLEVVHAAVGKTTGHIEFSEDFNGSIANASTTTRSVRVASFSVDDLVKNYFQPDIILMDIEGYEALALEGATQTLTQDIDWMIEVHSADFIRCFDRTPKDVLKPFQNGKFQLFIAPENGNFIPYQEGHPVMKDRFFLMAHHRST